MKRAIRENDEPTTPKIRRPIPERRRPLSASQGEWDGAQLEQALRRMKRL